jgi:DNA repair protein RecO (recombination protein O)
MTLFMSEVIYRVVKDRTGDEALFEWLKGEILTLDALESDFLNFHLLFLLDLCTALGFAPETEYLAPFAGEHLGQLGSLLSLPFEEALLLPMSGADRNEIAGSILRYIEHHTESAVNVRSLAVLREIYA